MPRLRVADAMKKRAAETPPEYIINLADNFYWAGSDPCSAILIPDGVTSVSLVSIRRQSILSTTSWLDARWIHAATGLYMAVGGRSTVVHPQGVRKDRTLE